MEAQNKIKIPHEIKAKKGLPVPLGIDPKYDFTRSPGLNKLYTPTSAMHVEGYGNCALQ
jgi:hypothetical protein